MTGDDSDNIAWLLSGRRRASITLAPPGAAREAQVRAIRRDLRSIRSQLSQEPGSMVCFPDGRIAVEVDRRALSRRELAFLRGLKAVRQQTGRKTREAGLFEALRGIGKRTPGALEAGAYDLLNAGGSVAGTSLLREIRRLRAEGTELACLTFYDKTERISRFRTGRLLRSEDLARVQDARRAAQEKFQPPDLRPATLEDMHRSPPKRGRPGLEDPWVSSFPAVYQRFGPKATEEQIHHAALNARDAFGARPTKRQAMRAWQIVIRLSLKMEPLWDHVVAVARERQLEARPAEAGFSSTLEQNVREAFLSVVLVGSRESDAKKVAALDILIHRHRREIG